MQIDDTRSKSKSQITKYLCRKEWHTTNVEAINPLGVNEVTNECRHEQNYMVDVTAIIKEEDTFGKNNEKCLC